MKSNRSPEEIAAHERFIEIIENLSDADMCRLQALENESDEDFDFFDRDFVYRLEALRN